MKPILLILLLIGSSTSSYCFQKSEIDTTRNDTISLHEIVVIAQRFETRIFERPEAISVLGKEVLSQLSPMDAPEALFAMPGVWIQKTNHGGGSPFIRGLTGYQTLILVDGIRFNNSTFRSGPNQYVNTIDVLALERIEVLRGQGSVQYGSDALGGAVQLLTRNPRFADSGTRMSGNLYGKVLSGGMEYTGRGEITIANPKWSILAGLTHKRLGDVKAGGSLGKLRPTGYEQLSGDVKSVLKIKENRLLTLGLLYLRQADVPLYHQIASGDFQTYLFDPQQRALAYLRIETSHSSKIFSTSKLTISYQNSLEKRIRQKQNSPVIVNDRDEVNTVGATFELLSEPSGNWKISSGLEIYHDMIGSISTSVNALSNEKMTARGLYPDDSKSSSFAIYSLHWYEWKCLNLSMGIRFNSVHLSVEDESFGMSRIHPSSFVGNMGLVYKINNQYRLVASVNSAFRAPNINDVSSFGLADFRYEIPNYNLQPEKSLNSEVGVKAQFANGSLAIHGYLNKLSNLITNVPASYMGQDSLEGKQVYKRENINRAIVRGIEAEGKIRISERLSLYGFLTYTYGHNTSKDEPMRRIPPINGRFGGQFKLGDAWFIRTDWIGAGSQVRLSSGDKNDKRIALGGTKSWQVFNVITRWDSDKIDINLGLQNIFNKAYRMHGSGIDGIGRNVWISVNLSIL